MLNAKARNVLLVLLTMTSGCVDSISFLKLGQVFTAAMTGNTVLLGISVTHDQGLAVFRYGVALLGFVLGAAVAASVLTRHRKTTGWSSVVTHTLWLELLALVVFSILINSLSAQVLGGLSDILILVLAFAMGVQGVVARRIGVNGVTTTVITSTLTGLVETVIWKTGHKIQSQGKGNDTKTADDTSPIRLVLMWVSVIVAYGAGAATCAAFVMKFAFNAIWLPVGFVLFVILVGYRGWYTSTKRNKQVSSEAGNTSFGS